MPISAFLNLPAFRRDHLAEPQTHARFSPLETALVLVHRAGGMAAAVPSFVSFAGYAWPAALPAPKINLGLDWPVAAICCSKPIPIR
jgi:hypothetical protein